MTCVRPKVLKDGSFESGLVVDSRLVFAKDKEQISRAVADGYRATFAEAIKVAAYLSGRFYANWMVQLEVLANQCNMTLDLMTLDLDNLGIPDSKNSPDADKSPESA